jgi:hypothetical protein
MQCSRRLGPNPISGQTQHQREWSAREPFFSQPLAKPVDRRLTDLEGLGDFGVCPTVPTNIGLQENSGSQRAG